MSGWRRLHTVARGPTAYVLSSGAQRPISKTQTARLVTEPLKAGRRLLQRIDGRGKGADYGHS